MSLRRVTHLLVAASLFGCGAEGGPGPDVTSDALDTWGDSALVSYDEFWEHNVVFDPERSVYVIEDDIVVSDSAAVDAYYEGLATPVGGLSVNRIGPTASIDDIWSRTDRAALTYCVSTNLGANHGQMVAALRRATAAWEGAAAVRFVHIAAEDANCTTANNRVKFNVIRGPDNMAGLADMSFPSTPRNQRQFRIRWAAGTTYGDELLTAICLHELGHGLGFRHEHIRAPGTNCVENNRFRALTPYDSLSAMHYPHCPGFGDPSWTWNFMTQWDIEGAQAVYEAPTNVLHAADGTLYARRRSDGGLYRKSAGAWTRIGNAGQAFLTVGNTLYGQRPGRGEPVRYDGPATGWTIIGGPAGQILNCAGALCATDPNNGNIVRYNGAGAGWTVIGGPGSRFAATTNTLYALTPAQHDVARFNGVGQGWTLVGGGASELFGGGTSMYRLTTARDAVQRYSGAGSVWNTIGGPGRQFLPSGAALYALTPDAGAVVRYSNGQWAAIGGPAARLYGSGGRLYATSPVDEVISRFNSANNTWIIEGKP